jgi:hypothetical protein
MASLSLFYFQTIHAHQAIKAPSAMAVKNIDKKITPRVVWSKLVIYFRGQTKAC